MANIQKRGENSYRITVSVGYDRYEKKIIERKTVKLDPTLTPKQRDKELERLAFAFEQEVRSGATIDSSMTFEAYAQKWLDEYASKQLERTTYESYERELENKILPSIGRIKLCDLKPLHLIKFYDNLTEDGVRADDKPGGYSTRMIKYQHQIISSMLQTAVHWQLIGHNVAQNVKPPKGTDRKKEENYLDEVQTKKFLEYVTQTQPLKYQALAQLAIFGGLRKGEILALTWRDVDFSANAVKVNKSLARIKGECIVKDTKNKSSVRTVTLPAIVVKTLKELKARSSSVTVLPIGYGMPTEWYRKTIKAYNAGMSSEADKLPEHTTFHGLRHTSATLLISQGLDIKTVSSRLGHNDTTTTLNVYAHAIKSRDEVASNALDNLLNTK